MYIRTISNKNKNGTVTQYVQIAHNQWDSQKKRSAVKVLLHLGRKEEVDIQGLERLIQSIQRFIGSNPAAADTPMIPNPSAASGFRLVSAKALGGVHFLDGLWRRLRIDQCLRELLVSRNYEIPIERGIFAMVANRALDPASKLSTETWVEHEAYIDQLPEVSVHQLYRAMDFLLENQEAVQREVFFGVASLLNLEVDLIYFDTTSTYFEIEDPDSEDDEDGDFLRQYGHSKDHRDDLPQIVIGMAVTKEGIPVRCWVFDGSTADVSIVDTVKRDLNGWKLGRVVSVCDRGFASEDNFIRLQSGGGHYIIGEKMRAGKPDVEAALSKRGRFAKIRENLFAKEAIIGDGERRKRYVICFNPAEAEKNRLTREKHLARLTEKLEALDIQEGKAHTKSACELISNPVYSRYLRQTKGGKPVLDKTKIAAEKRLDGKYLIRTSDDTLSITDVVLGYKQLLEIERGFRCLKTELALRPVYHRKSDRIRAHVLLCWLALLLVRVAENETGVTWFRLREELQRVHAVEVAFPEGVVWQTTEWTQNQRHFMNSCKLKLPANILNMRV